MTTIEEVEVQAMCDKCCHMVPKSDLTITSLFYVPAIDRSRFNRLCKLCYVQARLEGWI